jgi:hypothetical protein
MKNEFLGKNRYVAATVDTCVLNQNDGCMRAEVRMYILGLSASTLVVYL